MLCIRLAKVKATFTPNGDVSCFYAVSENMSRTSFKVLFAHGQPDCKRGRGLAPVACVSFWVQKTGKILEYKHGPSKNVGIQGTHTRFLVGEHSLRMRCLQTEHH